MKGRISGWIKGAALCFILGIFMPLLVYASDLDGTRQDTQESILGQMDFEEIDRALKELFPEEKLDFKQVISEVISGETEFSAGLAGRLIKDQLTYALRVNKENLIHIVFIAILAAVFTNFSYVFQNKQASEISFLCHVYAAFDPLLELFSGVDRLCGRGYWPTGFIYEGALSSLFYCSGCCKRERDVGGFL